MLGFRVWDKERKKIYTSATVGCFNSSMGGILENWNESGGLCEAEDRYIPMQSTGLNDFEGTEIFEGDIVKITCADTVIKITVHSSNTFLMSMGVLDDSFNTEHDKSIEECMKVIGNIYENPELLEELK